MINLVVDIGNSFSKLALFNNRELTSVTQVNNLTGYYLRNFLEQHTVHNSVISSVSSEISVFEDVLQQQSNYIRFSASSRARIISRYKTPQTLGLDRYAGVIGAQALYPAQSCLVIDAGSCITYDFIDDNGIYYGGSISPGIRMRLKAMNRFTGRLPLIEPDFQVNADHGDDTRSALLTGVQKGIIYEALGFIKSYQEKWPEVKVILCGGDVNFFDTELKNSIFAHTLKTEPHLVLIGLNEVILYNND
jgi:type III pantothenate kinase